MGLLVVVVSSKSDSPRTTENTRAISKSLLKSITSYTLGEFDICSRWRPQVFTLIYVLSAPANFKQRAMIRRTFGSSSLYTRLKTVTVFFIGTTSDKDVALAIRAESQRYHDIVQGEYVDSYRNLSLKAISTLKWLIDNCSNAKYVLKVDDDMFVNIFNLARHLQYLTKYQSDAVVTSNGSKVILPDNNCNKVIYCYVLRHMDVIRNNNSKWYVSQDEYPEDYFPPYCAGSVYFMESSLVPILYEAATVVSFLYIEDVYLTGLSAKEANITHHPINSIVIFDSKEFESQLVNGEAVFAPMEEDLRHKYWNTILLQEEWT